MDTPSNSIPGLQTISTEGCEDLIDQTISIMSARIRERRSDRPILESMMSAVNRHELQVPVISATLTRVVELMNKEHVCLEELSLAVEMDAALATKLMAVANSALLAGPTPICTISQALMRMGLMQARRIVVALALRSAVLRAPGFQKRAENLWEHSLLTGLACQALLEHSPKWSEVGFLLGLVHDIGHTVVLAFLSDSAGRIACYQHLSDEAIDSARTTTHACLGALAIHAWRFPDEFETAVLNHHRPMDTLVEKRELSWALYASDQLAKFYRSRPSAEEEKDDSPAAIELAETMEKLGIEAEHCNALWVKMEGGLKAFCSLA